MNFAIAKPSNFRHLYNFVKVKNPAKAADLFFKLEVAAHNLILTY